MNNAELIDKLRMEVENAPEPEYIDVRWQGLYDRLKRDILAGDPNAFLQFDTLKRSMHVGPGGATKKQYAKIRKRKDRDAWFEIAKETRIGKPHLLPWNKKVSGQSVAHALHLAKFQDATGLKVVDMEHVFEFGGGYGGMRRIIDRLGFEGDYVIYDLPVMSALQRFYLGSLGIEAKCVDRVEIAKGFLTGFDLNKSLFIATASLSEVPLDLRDAISTLVWEFRGILILFRHRFSTFDNMTYFRRWMKYREYRWEMSLDKSRGDRSYLFGVIEQDND